MFYGIEIISGDGYRGGPHILWIVIKWIVVLQIFFSLGRVLGGLLYRRVLEQHFKQINFFNILIMSSSPDPTDLTFI